MKNLSPLVIVLVTLLFSSNVAYAEDVWQMAESEKYGSKAMGMLGRGLINAASCFVDFVVHTVRETQEGPPLVGTLTGMGSGAACTVLRAGSGIVDVATFWVPGFNGIPVAKSYENCLLPEDDNYSYQASGTSTPTRSMPASSVRAPSRSSTTLEASRAHDPAEYVKK